jgi:biotin synthase
MCYAIPGKVVDIKDNVVTVDYFGERRKAKNDFYELSAGDYIYAQGGFVVQRVSRREAEEVLKIWEELFFKLQQTDLRLAQKPKDLRQIANSVRQKELGNSCCVHGILEFSNHCRNDCLYCGLRKSNSFLARYRMDVDEIVDTADFAVRELKFKALVLQSGEDLWYDEDKLIEMVERIRKKSPALIILSIGERPPELYEKLYKAGARGVLLRFETGNPALYRKMRPGHDPKARIDLIKRLHKAGYLIMTGFLIGLPGQTQEDLLKDIRLTASLGTEMFSFGPFIPHPQTPLAGFSSPLIEETLDTIARARIMNPESRILVTTSLETLDKENGLKQGLLAGGNSLMINVTPAGYRRLYDIYPDRAGKDADIKERIGSTVKLLYSIGRAPTDIGLGIQP